MYICTAHSCSVLFITPIYLAKYMLQLGFEDRPPEQSMELTLNHITFAEYGMDTCIVRYGEL